MKAIVEILKLDVADIVTASIGCEDYAGGSTTPCDGDEDC